MAGTIWAPNDISDQLKMLGEVLDGSECSSMSLDNAVEITPAAKTERKTLDIQLSEEALREFLEECIENTDQLEQDLLAIEEKNDDDAVKAPRDLKRKIDSLSSNRISSPQKYLIQSLSTF
ncbi:hypothetical protein SH501x_005044 [Pirellulaceae bacterium SH501]